MRYATIDDDTFRDQLGPSGLPSDYIELLVALFAAVRMGSAAQITDDVHRLAGVLARPLRRYARDYTAMLTT